MTWLRLLGVTILLSLAWLPAHAQSPRGQLNQMVQQLQQQPNDTALRENIIKLAQEAKPAPAVPEEARRHFVKAVTLQKEATGPSDYGQAIAEYQKALRIAPWWPDAYFNLSVAFEAAGRFGDAMDRLKLYLLTNPGEAEARSAQDKIYVLEAKQEKQAIKRAEQIAEENSPEAKLKKFFKSLDGGTWKVVSHSAYNYKNGSTWPEETENHPVLFIKIRGNEITEYQAPQDDPDGNHINDRFKTTFHDRSFETTSDMGFKVRITISEDGQTILDESWAMPQPSMYWKQTYQRIK